MRVHVGSTPIIFEVQQGMVLDSVGQPTLARVDFGHARGVISSECPAVCRLAALCAATANAWLSRVPQPRGRNDMAKLIGTITESIIRDVEQQGGSLAVLMMDAPESADALPDEPLAGSATEVLRQCSCCGQRVASGSVAVSSAYRDPKLGAPVADVSFACASCNDVEVSTELVNGVGHPSGQRVGCQRLTGEQAREWIRDHPEQTRDIVMS